MHAGIDTHQPDKRRRTKTKTANQNKHSETENTANEQVKVTLQQTQKNVIAHYCTGYEPNTPHMHGALVYARLWSVHSDRSIH